MPSGVYERKRPNGVPPRAEYNRQYYKENAVKLRAASRLRGVENHLLRSYGMTAEEYQARLDSQDGTCAICKSLPSANKKLAVDHDHSDPNKKVRDLLCDHCNWGLGHFKDNTSLLLGAVEYLERHA